MVAFVGELTFPARRHTVNRLFTKNDDWDQENIFSGMLNGTLQGFG